MSLQTEFEVILASIGEGIGSAGERGLAPLEATLEARAELNEALIAFGATRSGKRYSKEEAALIKMARAAMAHQGGT